MDAFEYRDGQLRCDEVSIAEALAAEHGTPLYIYSAAGFRERLSAFAEAFRGLRCSVCYAVKSSSNLSILKLVAEAGAGFDVVSGGEIERVIRAGGDPSRIVYAGVGKTDAELAFALSKGIHHFNIENESELTRLNQLAAAAGTVAPIAIRINPDVDPQTHRYITTGKSENKFGLDLEQAAALFQRRDEFSHLDFRGLHCHIGSQVQSAAPFVKALEKVAEFLRARRAEGAFIRFLNLGGGFGIDYEERCAPEPSIFAEALRPILETLDVELIIEPGRSISAHAGLLLVRVLDIKQSGERRFVIVDGAMNDLIRPCLYEAHHEIWPVESPRDPRDIPRAERGVPTDIVGPICESGDFLAKDCRLPELRPGQLLAVFSAGAYGFSMASNYNSRPRAAELLIDGAEARLIRRRESIEDLIGPELDCL